MRLGSRRVPASRPGTELTEVIGERFALGLDVAPLVRDRIKRLARLNATLSRWMCTLNFQSRSNLIGRKHAPHVGNKRWQLSREVGMALSR